LNPYDKAHELARAIRSHDSFQALLKAKARVDQDPQAKNIVEDFRKRQWEFEAKRLMGQEISEAEQQQLAKMQEALTLVPAAREYLQAEYQFSVLFGDIQKILAEAVQDVFGPMIGQGLNK
jgi:cell fate (sporulation/competence/biofilm development) regulator YlbF (YheA/YmcA/DUF963 family)